jgi:outer membrane immunogenic protein
MRKMLFAGALLAAAIGQASAADLPRKAPVMRAPIVDTWTWTGFYIGGNAGYSWGKWDSTSLGAIFPGAPGLFSTTASPNVDGFVAGGQIGYNWQVDYWVLGFETDLQWTGEKASNAHTVSIGPFPFPGDSTAQLTGTNTNNWSFPWFGTFRGRVGWTTADHWLFYATGGLAYGNAKFSNVGVATLTVTSPVAGTFSNSVATGFSGSTTRIGWTVGGGIEKAFTRNWSVKAEYLYVDLGNYTFGAGTGLDTNVRLRDHIARVGINYKFDTGPVVAKY